MFVLILVLSLILFLSRIWVAEDAYIFFRYVENFVSGNGLVFNLGEKVEGYTSPLWVFILSFLRFITGFELRPISIILGLFLSLLSVYLILKFDKYNSNHINIHVGLLLLVSTSFIRDYATSGFETSLTLLLTTSLALIIKNYDFMKKSLETGILLSLLILTRPESFLIYIYLIIFYFLFSFKIKNLLYFIKFVIPSVLLVGGYQIFRFFYFNDLFPNTYYAKKGDEMYLIQGVNYLKDFIFSYPITCLILFISLGILIFNYYKNKNSIYKININWIHLLISAILIVFYVLRSGGDYMHGRSLLIPFVLICISINHVFELIQNKHTKFTSEFSFLLSIVIIFIGLFQVPLTVRHSKEINFINDERNHFGIKVPYSNLLTYVSLKSTDEFGWASRGNYYKDLSKKLNIPISVVIWNIGLFGYNSGPNVSVEGAVLIDKYIAKQKILNRGKIGHENLPNWEYVFSRKPTFSYTPFSYWNKNAQYKYSASKYSYIISDDRNDSFIPVFDLSNLVFIEKFSKLINIDIKTNIDNSTVYFLRNVSKDDIASGKFEKFNMDIKEYMDFLKYYWLPYASKDNQLEYDNTLYRLGLNDYKGSYSNFFESKKGE